MPRPKGGATDCRLDPPYIQLRVRVVFHHGRAVALNISSFPPLVALLWFQVIASQRCSAFWGAFFSGNDGHENGGVKHFLSFFRRSGFVSSAASRPGFLTHLFRFGAHRDFGTSTWAKGVFRFSLRIMAWGFPSLSLSLFGISDLVMSPAGWSGRDGFSKHHPGD